MKTAARQHVAQLSDALSRLQSESRRTLAQCNLGGAVTWKRLVEAFPDVDRGTAHRFLRFVRWHKDPLLALEAMPGPRGWQKVVFGVENLLGESEPQTARFRAAVDEVVTAVYRLGGSFEEAKRISKDLAGVASEPAKHASRAGWFQSSAETMGYSVSCRVDIALLRINPDHSDLMDSALVQAFHGMQGQAGCVPFVFAYESNSDQPLEDPDSAWEQSKSYLLGSGTSAPPPDILFADGDRPNVAIVQSDWATRYESLDLAVLRSSPASCALPWEGPDQVQRTHTANTHPARRLVIDRLVSKSFLRDASIEFACTRLRPGLGFGNGWVPWFDKLPETAEVQRFGHYSELTSPEGCPDYARILSESLEKLDWDADDLVPFRVTVDHPLPLANYVFALHYG